MLNEFPYPMTVTMVQLLSITVYSGPLFKLWGIRPGFQSSISKDYYWKMIIPLAIGKFLSSVFSHVSIWKVPVSFAHTGKLLIFNSFLSIFTYDFYFFFTVKASMPLFTVTLSRLILGEKQTTQVMKSKHISSSYFSLISL